MSPADDELFDDLHEGVEALRQTVKAQAIPLSQKAAESIQRLQASVPAAKTRLHAWKEIVKEKAIVAARQTDRAAHQYPWIFTLSALGVGLLTGLLIASAEPREEEPEA